jgi:hypothetical protein
MASFVERLQHAWNAFKNDDASASYRDYGYITSSYNPSRRRLSRGNERTIVNAVLNRIAVDAASISIKHVRVDESNRFKEEMNSDLNRCLSISANIDQTGRAFIQDAVMSMLDEGVIAIVPVDTTFNPRVTGSYDIQSLRVGKITQWYPRDVRVRLYNDRIGQNQEIVVPKTLAAVIENPFYSVMNEPSSTLQRLIRKLNLLDVLDEQNSSGKLDLIIQLPYVIKTEARREQAELRRREIEKQLTGSKYGIAYTDGTERITQLNRAVENNLMSQVEYLTSMLYSQLGMTQEILNGSANEETMNNYYTRIIEPIDAAICDGMTRTYLTKTALTQGQKIMYFREPFKLMPVSNIAEIADKFTRNEIMSPNEVRQIVGLRPSEKPEADELRNRNINQSNEEMMQEVPEQDSEETAEV